MKPDSARASRIRWAGVALGCCAAAGGAFLYLHDDGADRRALADLQKSNEARREALAARERQASPQQPGEPAISTPAPADGQSTAAAAPPTDVRDLVRRIDRLSEKLSSLERAALELDRRIVSSKLEVPPEPSGQEQQIILQEMATELELKRQQCAELFAKVRQIAAAARVAVADNVLHDLNATPPAGLEKNQAFMEAWAMAKQNENLLKMLIQRYAQEKLGAPRNR